MCGSIAGACGILLSHPIDTMKTRLQTKTALTLSTAFKMGALYGGLRGPLLGTIFEKSIVFGSYDYAKKYKLNDFTAGIIGGLMCTIIVTPIEYFKINAQNKHKIDISNIRLSNIYKGFLPTICRETPGFGIYFATYNYLNENHNQQKSLFMSFMFGGTAGLSAWLFIYPADLIKTNVQDKYNTKSIRTIITNIYQTDGLAGFYKGFKYAAMRAIPLHAGVFVGFEVSKKYFMYNTKT